MKKNYQQTLTCKSDVDGVERTWKSSFGSFEKAKDDAEKFINKTEPWMKYTVVSAQIVNKETNEVLYRYNA